MPSPDGASFGKAQVSTQWGATPLCSLLAIGAARTSSTIIPAVLSDKVSSVSVSPPLVKWGNTPCIFLTGHQWLHRTAMELNMCQGQTPLPLLTVSQCTCPGQGPAVYGMRESYPVQEPCAVPLVNKLHRSDLARSPDDHEYIVSTLPGIANTGMAAQGRSLPSPLANYATCQALKPLPKLNTNHQFLCLATKD